MTAAAATPAAKINIAKVAFTSLAASSIEWYDFFIYGTAAALVFPKLFFASTLPPAVAQVAAFATYSVGFFARPVGGILFGHFGDLVGRKKALVTALLMMGCATTAVGLLPTYAQVGVAAPLLLILLRFVKGLAVRGQWGGAILLAIDNSPQRLRGFYGSFAQMGVPAGVITANLIFLILGAALAPEAFLAWAWRIPFLLSIVLVGLGLYVQLRLEDTAEFQALQALEAKKLAQAARALADEKEITLPRAHAILRAEKGSPILKVLAQHPKKRSCWRRALVVASNGTLLCDDHLCGGLCDGDPARRAADDPGGRPDRNGALLALPAAHRLALGPGRSARRVHDGRGDDGRLVAGVLQPGQHRRLSDDAAGDRRGLHLQQLHVRLARRP